MDNFKIKLRLVKFSDEIYYAVDELYINTYIENMKKLFNNSKNIIEVNEYMFDTHAEHFFEVDEEKYNSLLDKAFVIDKSKLQDESELLMTACNYQGEVELQTVETAAGGEDGGLRNRKIVIFVDGMKVILALYCVTTLSVSIKTALDNLDESGQLDIETARKFICDVINYDQLSISGVTSISIYTIIDNISHGIVGTWGLKDRLDCIADAINFNFTKAHERCTFDNYNAAESALSEYKKYLENTTDVGVVDPNGAFWEDYSNPFTGDTPRQLGTLVTSNDYFFGVAKALKADGKPVNYKYYSTVTRKGYDVMYKSVQKVTAKVLGVKLDTPSEVFFDILNRGFASYFSAEQDGIFSVVFRNSQRNLQKKMSALMASVFSVFIVLKNIIHGFLFEVVFRMNRSGGYTSTVAEAFGRIFEYVNLTSLLLASGSYSAYYAAASKDAQQFDGFRNTVMSATAVHCLLYYLLGSSFRNVVQRSMDQMFTFLFLVVVLERNFEDNTMFLGSQYASMSMAVVTLFSTWMPYIVYKRAFRGKRKTNKFMKDLRKEVWRFGGGEDDEEYRNEMQIQDNNVNRGSGIRDALSTISSMVNRQPGESRSDQGQGTPLNEVRTVKVSTNTSFKCDGIKVNFKILGGYVDVVIDDELFCRFYGRQNVLEIDSGETELERVNYFNNEQVPGFNNLYYTYNERGCSFSITNRVIFIL